MRVDIQTSSPSSPSSPERREEGGGGGQAITDERGRARTSAGCDDCDEARRRATTGLVVCVCGRAHGPDDARWPRDTPEPITAVRPRPGLDLPVGTVPAPRRPPPRIDRDSDEVARVRRLLAELRPHGPGPAEPLDGAEGKGASLAPRTTARAPWDVAAPAGAFLRDTAGEAALAVVQRIARVPSERARTSLAWLRRSGTLLHGYGWLAVELAQVLADADRRAAWQADESHGADRERAYGAARLEEACAAWDATRVST